MRKQVQKERCTKIMLTKCKAVCCLYDKVQLAAAKMLDIYLQIDSLIGTTYQKDERNVSIRSQHVPYSAAVRHGRKDCGKMGETVRAMILSAIVYNGSYISMLPLFPYLPPFFYYFYVLFSSHRIPFESR